MTQDEERLVDELLDLLRVLRETRAFLDNFNDQVEHALATGRSAEVDDGLAMVSPQLLTAALADAVAEQGGPVGAGDVATRLFAEQARPSELLRIRLMLGQLSRSGLVVRHPRRGPLDSYGWSVAA